jgi:CheY-like chemotaxis protein
VSTQTPRGHGETLLVVEDNDSLLRLTVEALESLDYRVLAMGTPSEALVLPEAALEGVSLLVTDVVMPEMNGLELADRLCQRRPGLKCLFVSGYSADIMASQGFLPEGLAFLQKPFSIGNLAIKVREILAPK